MIQSLLLAVILMALAFLLTRITTWWKTLKVRSNIRHAGPSTLHTAQFQAADLFNKRHSSFFGGYGFCIAVFFIPFLNSLNLSQIRLKFTKNLLKLLQKWILFGP